MLKNFKNKKKKGFTLIELIIVIAIIAILAAVAIPKFGNVRRSANYKADIANAKTIANAVSALITEGAIEENVAKIDLSTTGGDADDIKGYLQTTPTPKAVTGKFVVKVENGNVIVNILAGESETAGPANQIYPQPSETGANIWYGGTAPVVEKK